MASGLKFWIDILSALFAISAAMMWIFSSQVRTADEKPRASGDASKKTGIP
jgi:hypothetical protein